MFPYRQHQNYIGSVFSFGAGTQSTAILLLMVFEPERLLKTVGHLPNWVIFADTGAESQEALQNLEACKKLHPIIRIKRWKRNALTHPLDPPYFLDDGGFLMRRQCTGEWKVTPLKRAVRKLYPQKSPKKPVAQWLGISIDEIQRMKVSDVKSIELVYPLIELGMTRQDCVDIIKKYGMKPIKSSCYMCPFQGKNWAQNPEVEKAIAYEKWAQSQRHNHGVKKNIFLHFSAQPLDVAVAKQKAQGNLFTFDDECSGFCGV